MSSRLVGTLATFSSALKGLPVREHRKSPERGERARRLVGLFGRPIRLLNSDVPRCALQSIANLMLPIAHMMAPTRQTPNLAFSYHRTKQPLVSRCRMRATTSNAGNCGYDAKRPRRRRLMRKPAGSDWRATRGGLAVTLTGAGLRSCASSFRFRMEQPHVKIICDSSDGATEWRRLQNWSQKSAEKFSSFGEGATAFGCSQGGANAGERPRRSASAVRSKRNCQS